MPGLYDLRRVDNVFSREKLDGVDQTEKPADPAHECHDDACDALFAFSEDKIVDPEGEEESQQRKQVLVVAVDLIPVPIGVRRRSTRNAAARKGNAALDADRRIRVGLRPAVGAELVARALFDAAIQADRLIVRHGCSAVSTKHFFSPFPTDIDNKTGFEICYKL